MNWLPRTEMNENHDMLQIHTIVSVPFEENTYIAWRPDRHDALVIDPGLEPKLILSFLQSKKLNVAAILNTHGHADHIGGNEALKAQYPEAPLVIGKGDAPMLTDANLNLSAPFGMAIVSPPADQLVAEGDVLDLAGIQLDVREIPGHSLGHVVFIVKPSPTEGTEEYVVFGGDVLFRGSIGRTDFPGGSFDKLAVGIRTKLYTLPDDTVVYSGHGPTTTIGVEKRTNPFVAG
jgi:glyoxylase-like metal-dependent hydrolase (beta-lactamase superfamily II)